MLQKRAGERTSLQPLLAFAALAVVTGALLWVSGVPVAVWRTTPEAVNAGSDAVDGVADAAEVVAAVLAIAVTVVAIVVELAANRYSHLITRLFVREPVNFLVLGLFVVTTVQCLWLGQGNVPRAEVAAGSAVTLTLVTLSLLTLLPYVYYLFNFLSPISIIDRIYANACRSMARAARAPRAREGVQNAVDELQDVARSAVVRGDRAIAMAGVDALALLVHRHAELRDRLPPEWFTVNGSLARDPDFVALADETLQEVASQGTWLETKIFRRLVALVGQSTGHSRDVANLVAMHTGRIAADEGIARPELMTLCIRAFNSYLRTTLNGRDMRTAYYIQNQYRLVAERLLAAGQAARVDEIAEHLAYYGRLAHQANLSFLLETAAHDIAGLVRAALEAEGQAAAVGAGSCRPVTDQALVDRLLARLLALDQEIREESQEESLLGVRRAQIKLAAWLIHRGETERAVRIARDLEPERPERLERLREGLLRDERAQYWELIDRGTNFAYLAPELRPHLDTLYGWIRSPPV